MEDRNGLTCHFSGSLCPTQYSLRSLSFWRLTRLWVLGGKHIPSRFLTGSRPAPVCSNYAFGAPRVNREPRRYPLSRTRSQTTRREADSTSAVGCSTFAITSC